MRLAPGSSFGPYTIESRLGEGGIGVVYLASDPTLGRKVALKLLSPALAVDPDFRSRFIAEARSAAALDHPHILPVYDAGEQDGQLYLAIRYVPGFDLGTLIAREGALPLERTVRFLGQIAAALDAAHASGLVHRDVKPTNVLVAPGEHAYLADFGLARPTTPYTSGLTRPGQLVGSVDYLAPELLSGAPASARSDIYALGCLVVECLTGTPPFRRDSELATLYAHAHDPVPMLSMLRADLPLGLDAVLQRALAKRPEERYETATEFAAAVATAAQELVVTGAAPVADAIIAAGTPSERSRANDSTVHIAKPKRIVALRLLVASLLSLVLFGTTAIALVANDRSARDPNAPTSSVLPTAESVVSSAPSSSPSASAMPALVSLSLEELMLPLSEFPFPSHEVAVNQAVGDTGWMRSFTWASPIRPFTEQTVQINVFPTAEETRKAVGLVQCGEVLSSLPVGDSSKACMRFARAPTVTATVEIFASSRNLLVIARVVPSDVITATAALERAGTIARAQLARLDRLARDSSLVQIALATPLPSLAASPPPPGCTEPAPISAPPPGYRFIGCTATGSMSHYGWASPGSGPILGPAFGLRRYPRGTLLGLRGDEEVVDINGYAGAISADGAIIWWDSAYTYSLYSGPLLTREARLAFARSVH